MTDEMFYLVDCKDGEQRLYRGRRGERLGKEAIPFQRMEEQEVTILQCKTCSRPALVCECELSERNLQPFTTTMRINREALGKWAAEHLDELKEVAKGNFSDGKSA